jgi:coenzyme F420-dependent glucose-6-phosphate dehydrogenase
VLAQQIATLELLNPGRFILGVGSGEALNEMAVGLGQWPEFKERSARLRESIALMRELWSRERVTFEGDYYRTIDATVYDRPDGGRVPIYVSAGGPQMAKTAGRIGDGFICTSGKGMELYTEQLLPAVEEGLAAVGRSSEGFARMIEIKLSYARTREKAMANCRFWAPLSLTPEEKHDLSDPVQMSAHADRLPIERVAKRWIIATTPDEVEEAVRPYLEAGFDHLVFHAPGHDQKEFLSLFAEEVLPVLRALEWSTPAS